MDVVNFFPNTRIVRPSIVMKLCSSDDTMFYGREELLLYMYKRLCFVEPSVHYHSTLNVALFYSSATQVSICNAIGEGGYHQSSIKSGTQ